MLKTHYVEYIKFAMDARLSLFSIEPYQDTH